MRKIRPGNGRNKSHYIVGKRRLLGRSSLSSELRTLRTLRSDDATVDVLGMCGSASPFECQKPLSYGYDFQLGCETYRRGLRCCLSFLRRRVRRPGTQGKQQSTDLTLLILCSLTLIILTILAGGRRSFLG